MSTAQVYDLGFFEGQADGSRRSADAVVPVALDLIQPSSVVDVGCGVGTWLAAVRAAGIDDILGVDGDYVAPTQLQIPESAFLAADLTTPLSIGRTFDLAICLEVAEHLPSSIAETFITTLTDLAPVILFSAAIPGQGGRNHVNEQWPEYWVAKFAARSYMVFDVIRPIIWRDERVEACYAQNTFLYVRADSLGHYPRLWTEQAYVDRERLALVHPRLFTFVNDWYATHYVSAGSARSLARALLPVLGAAIKRRLVRARTRAMLYRRVGSAQVRRATDRYTASTRSAAADQAPR